jgi:hypothetical protein
LRRAPAGSAQGFDQPEERLVAFGEVGDLDRPAVLVRIDVEVEIAGPAHVASEIIIPDPLEVGRQRRVLAGPGDEQVATVLEKLGDQRLIVPALPHTGEAFIGRKRQRRRPHR